VGEAITTAGSNVERHAYILARTTDPEANTIAGFAHKVGEMDIPRLFKAGSPSDPTLERSGGAVRNEPRSAPYFVEVTNRY